MFGTCDAGNSPVVVLGGREWSLGWWTGVGERGMLSRSDRGGRDVSRGGIDVDGFVAPLPAPVAEPPVGEFRRSAGVVRGSGSSCHLRPSGHGDRSQRPSMPDQCRSLYVGHVRSRFIDESDSEARQFAQRAVRVVLEVLDRRRPVAHLDSIANTSVVAAVRTLVRDDLVPGRALGVAVSPRVDVVMVSDAAAELVAAYDRGSRHFALAARISRTRRKGWRLTAVRVR